MGNSENDLYKEIEYGNVIFQHLQMEDKEFPETCLFTVILTDIIFFKLLHIEDDQLF